MRVAHPRLPVARQLFSDNLAHSRLIYHLKSTTWLIRRDSEALFIKKARMSLMAPKMPSKPKMPIKPTMTTKPAAKAQRLLREVYPPKHRHPADPGRRRRLDPPPVLRRGRVEGFVIVDDGPRRREDDAVDGADEDGPEDAPKKMPMSPTTAPILPSAMPPMMPPVMTLSGGFIIQ